MANQAPSIGGAGRNNLQPLPVVTASTAPVTSTTNTTSTTAARTAGTFPVPAGTQPNFADYFFQSSHDSLNQWIEQLRTSPDSAAELAFRFAEFLLNLGMPVHVQGVGPAVRRALAHADAHGVLPPDLPLPSVPELVSAMPVYSELDEQTQGMFRALLQRAAALLPATVPPPSAPASASPSTAPATQTGRLDDALRPFQERHGKRAYLAFRKDLMDVLDQCGYRNAMNCSPEEWNARLDTMFPQESSLADLDTLMQEGLPPGRRQEVFDRLAANLRNTVGAMENMAWTHACSPAIAPMVSHYAGCWGLDPQAAWPVLHALTRRGKHTAEVPEDPGQVYLLRKIAAEDIGFIDMDRQMVFNNPRSTARVLNAYDLKIDPAKPDQPPQPQEYIASPHAVQDEDDPYPVLENGGINLRVSRTPSRENPRGDQDREDHYGGRDPLYTVFTLKDLAAIPGVRVHYDVISRYKDAVFVELPQGRGLPYDSIYSD